MNKKARNSSYMKLANRKLILNMIRSGSLSRAELARKTGLTRAAITLIIDEMIKDGIVMETGVSQSASGRRPIILDINPKRYYTVGLNLIRYGCSVGLVNLKGEVVLKRNVEISGCKNPFEALNIIIKDIERLISDSNIEVSRLLGLGVCTPGPVDIHKGVILNPPNFEMWHNFSIAGELERALKLPVMLENISNGRTIAEKNYGRGAGLSSFMLVAVDEGIGAGIVIDNKLYHGIGGYGSELGHTSIKLDGIRCSCGNRGCLETYASIPNVLKEIQRHDRSVLSWSQVVDMAENGDKLCLKAVDNEAHYLSAGIVNAMNLLELEAVILAGDISCKPGLLVEKIREKVRSISITRGIRNIEIFSSSIVKDSETISSASTVIEGFFSLDNPSGFC
jgi:predicted NBD/HSP70 family sugar kinase